MIVCDVEQSPGLERGKTNAENRMFVSANIRILLSLSIMRFVYKRLNIIFAGYAQRFSSSGKGLLRFTYGRSRGVTENDFPILLLDRIL